MPKKRLNEAVEREMLKEKGAAGIERELAARGGTTRSDLMSDKDRGAVSSLGHGSGAKKMVKKGGKK